MPTTLAVVSPAAIRATWSEAANDPTLAVIDASAAWTQARIWVVVPPWAQLVTSLPPTETVTRPTLPALAGVSINCRGRLLGDGAVGDRAECGHRAESRLGASEGGEDRRGGGATAAEVLELHLLLLRHIGGVA